MAESEAGSVERTVTLRVQSKYRVQILHRCVHEVLEMKYCPPHRHSQRRTLGLAGVESLQRQLWTRAPGTGPLMQQSRTGQWGQSLQRSQYRVQEVSGWSVSRYRCFCCLFLTFEEEEELTQTWFYQSFTSENTDLWWTELKLLHLGISVRDVF